MAAAKEKSPLQLALLVLLWYAGNTFYNIYNKKASKMLHAHWFIACAQLVVGMITSFILWGTKLRKTPNLSTADLVACVPIGLCACFAHAFSVLAMGMGAVSFAQIVKACEPVFAAVIGLLLPPIDLKPMLAYMMLVPIVGGVGLACIKEGKGLEINVAAFTYASMANVAAALKGKIGGSVVKSLKGDSSKNMDSANVYGVMNIMSFLFTVPMVIAFEMQTLPGEWEKAVAEHGASAVIQNIALSGFFYYIYNEFAFAFTASVGAVTSSVLNTAKRVIIIVVSSILFQEAMTRNTVLGSAIAIGGTFAYSLASKGKKKVDTAKKAQ
mmetsp:Transcript_2065/g.2514  ORF Transcript_2065/g.2514 Transcript_2065/m.2514 type:complete len:326 (+) Transcript_2065:73-1050(+)|eukprot:CAMPEP_0194129598 /NCGR_PEP_ID=MMETSP0152-20130528/810_1 /TAXON_ID=1049557 /ORGANISM="Thalassiothrix antarctica, Strain L6-D1" /LENGTH=325 /DNA_ID=CAMNT_0038823871 /DNA_START=50 /DNA_END=1027 /DNA_ORIENTATION=-